MFDYETLDGNLSTLAPKSDSPLSGALDLLFTIFHADAARILGDFASETIAKQAIQANK
jgi:hypothetical protein